MSEENVEQSSEQSLTDGQRRRQIDLLKLRYLDLLIEIPLSYQTHEMVELRRQIKELKEKVLTE